jgi:phage/conjugal plasmid C-4 type zinc finger TraR family protein
MDQFDQAQELDAIFRQQALAAHVKKAAHTGESRTNCLDCGEPIPEGRRKILPGCIRCIGCATMFEAENTLR